MEEPVVEQSLAQEYSDLLPVILCLILIGGIQLLFVALLYLLGLLVTLWAYCRLLDIITRNRT